MPSLRPSLKKTYLHEKDRFISDPFFSDDPLQAASFALGRIKLNLAAQKFAEEEGVPAGVFWIYEEVSDAEKKNCSVR
jgi:hypothetical protein